MSGYMTLEDQDAADLTDDALMRCVRVAVKRGLVLAERVGQSSPHDALNQAREIVCTLASRNDKHSRYWAHTLVAIDDAIGAVEISECP
jgi:hypothetical protein